MLNQYVAKNHGVSNTVKQAPRQSDDQARPMFTHLTRVLRHSGEALENVHIFSQSNL